MFVFNFIYTKVLALTYSTIVKYNVVNNRIIKTGTLNGTKRGMLFKILKKILFRNLLWYLINCSLTSLPCSAVTQNNSQFPKTSLFTSSINFLLLQEKSLLEEDKQPYIMDFTWNQLSRNICEGAFFT